MATQQDRSGEPFGRQLRTYRQRAGLTQEELARRAGLTAHAVSALERGTRTRPYPHTVRALAGALELGPAEQRELVDAVPSRRTEDEVVRAGPDGGEQVPRSSRLVVPPTRLHGREGDLTALTSLVRSGHCRLLTLTGMGGVGKTRLAVALAEELRADFPAGTLALALASVPHPAAVVDRIGRTLGLTGGDGPEGVDLVAAHLGGRRTLLLLDNLEHLLDAGPAVARLVALCPALVVVVASRAPLRVRGEHEYPVGPLALPAPEAATADELAAAPAGALVLDRVRAVAPQLELGPGSVRALRELTARLAGIPLALELAAARLRLLGPTVLLERLDSVLDSASSARDLPPRQRTMRATLDWSHGLLTPDQQQLFAVLGVFRGGASLDAVEQVVAASTGLRGGEVVEQLGLLVEQSMVLVRDGGDGQPRYGMLEPVSQYADGLLVGDQRERAVRAHAAVYRALAEQAARGYERTEQVAWLARTESDEANLAAAVERSLAGGDPDTAGRIVWALWLYWWLRGQFAVGRRRAEQVLRAPLSPAVLARVTLTAATMAYAGGDVEAAAGYWAEAFRLGDLQDDAEVGGKGLAGTGLSALAGGELELAAERFSGSITLSERAGEAGVWMRSLAHVWLGTVRLLQGDPAAALPEIHRGLTLARGRGDRLSTYVGLYNLSQAALAAGDLDLARHHLEEGIVLSEQTADLANLAHFLEALAVVESERGSLERLPVLLGAAGAFRDTVGADVYAYYLPDPVRRQQAEAQARAALGQQRYAAAEQRGSRLSLAAAVRFAFLHEASSGRTAAQSGVG